MISHSATRPPTFWTERRRRITGCLPTSTRARLLILMLFTALLIAQRSYAQDAGGPDVSRYTVDTIVQWLHKYQDAQPTFKPGDVLTSKDIERLRPFMAPGYLEQLNFPGARVKVVETVNHTPRRDFMECTEKYQRQVRLRDDGTIDNYTCGQPFSDATIDANDPRSGVRAAWNFEYRWQNVGHGALDWLLTILRFPGNHGGQTILPEPIGLWTLPHNSPLPTDVTDQYGGGGYYQRTMACVYWRFYLSHLAPFANSGGVLPGAQHGEDFEFKEFTGFYAPFDIRGTAFVVWRYSDPYRGDDAWAYLPAIRRVRRVTAEVKSDSLLGTDHTISDFYGFADRVVNWDWKFLGWKTVLAIHDMKQPNTHLYGPNGLLVDDVWSLRKYAVILRTPKDPRNPYSAVINFWDAENWDSWWTIAFDRRGNLWKIWQWPKRWSEDYQNEPFAEWNVGVRATSNPGPVVVDVQNSRGTIILNWGRGFPIPSPGYINSVIEPSSLELTHR
ncbi:MAG TPA: DUF1329 domain-containing protein [Candidatus Binataceae bacterium]|nr:DUF1329 domain-containing protein [Candidatus Binataceae bacterium]